MEAIPGTRSEPHCRSAPSRGSSDEPFRRAASTDIAAVRSAVVKCQFPTAATGSLVSNIGKHAEGGNTSEVLAVSSVTR